MENKIPKIKLQGKPTYVKFGQDVDFYGLFQKIERECETCFLLESLTGEERISRYSVIGFTPNHLIRARGRSLFIDDQEYDVENPYFRLRDVVPQDAISRNYAGGLVGFIGYDSVNYFEQKLTVKTHEMFDRFMFGVYTDGLVFDKETNELYYFFYEDDRRDFLREVMSSRLKRAQTQITFLGNTLTETEHKKKFTEIMEEIRAGNTFQCQLGFKSEYQIAGDTLPIYTRLRKINPSPHMYYVKFGETKIIGASPELLFRLRDREMETFPLAGTIGRGKTEAEDKTLARMLLNDPKENAEHNMLVDLHRNDLGRVAQFGSVKVRSLKDIKKFAYVAHLSSEIAGIMRTGEDMFSGLAANFPAGTLTGAPKFESMKIIDRVEEASRGPYGGALGHFGFNGDCTFAIPIRTLFISGTYAFTQASGGIVADSDAHKEYQEIEKKLQAMKEVLSL